MSFGTWYLTTPAASDIVAKGSLHTVGIIDLQKQFRSARAEYSLIIDAGDSTSFSVDLVLGLIVQVHHSGTRVVLVDGRGVLTGFLFDAGLSGWVRVVPSLNSAWELVRALGQRVVPLASDEEPAPAGMSGELGGQLIHLDSAAGVLAGHPHARPGWRHRRRGVPAMSPNSAA